MYNPTNNIFYFNPITAGILSWASFGAPSAISLLTTRSNSSGSMALKQGPFPTKKGKLSAKKLAEVCWGGAWQHMRASKTKTVRWSIQVLFVNLIWLNVFAALLPSRPGSNMPESTSSRVVTHASQGCRKSFRHTCVGMQRGFKGSNSWPPNYKMTSTPGLAAITFSP